jgi:hypothetical protein
MDVVTLARAQRYADSFLGVGMLSEETIVEDDLSIFRLQEDDVADGGTLILDITCDNSVLIKSVGKNLFDGELELGIYSITTGNKGVSTDFCRSVNKIPVKASTEYVLSNAENYYFYVLYYTGENGETFQSASAITRTFTTPADCTFVTFRTSGSGNNNINSLIQLEYGSIATDIETYKLRIDKTMPGVICYTKCYSEGTVYLTGIDITAISYRYQKDMLLTKVLNKDLGVHAPALDDEDLNGIWEPGTYMVGAGVENRPPIDIGTLVVCVERAKLISPHNNTWIVQTATRISDPPTTYKRIFLVNESTGVIAYDRGWKKIISDDDLIDASDALGLSIVNQDWAQLERNFTWTEGYYKYWDGSTFVTTANSSLKYSQLIPVAEGETWRTVSYLTTGFSWAVNLRGYLLNTDGEWVQNISPDVNSTNYGVCTIIIPPEVTHMVVVARNITDYRATRLLKLHDFENIWDEATYGKTDGKYIDNNGVEQTNADLSYTGAIPVIAGEIYRIANVNGGSGSTFTARGVFLDDVDTLIGVIPANPDSLPIITFNDVVVPDGATKMIVNFFNNIITRTDVYKSMTINIAVSATPIYANNSKIRDKSWVSYGDSTTYYAEWQKMVENAIGIKSYELGYSSASVTTHHADNTLTDTTRLDALIAMNPDIITILGGLNDDSSVDIGDESAMAATMGTEDLSTFYGAYSYIIKYILTALPEVRLILLTTTCSANTPANVRFAQAVKVLGEYFGLEVIDARSAMGMNVLTEYIYTVDKVHIAYRGAKRIANTVINTFLQ